MVPSITYLSYRIAADELHPLDDQVWTIKDPPTPKSVRELKPYLCMLSCYSQFLPNLSSILHPLYHLLKKNVPWVWKASQSKAFTAYKEVLISANCLTHYNSSLGLTLARDASKYGLGAVSSHKMLDGSDRPVAHASHVHSTCRNVTTFKLRKRSCCVYLASRGFTTTCLDGTFNWWQTTNLLWAFWKKTWPLHCKHPQESNVGHCSSQTTNIAWCSETPELT